MKLSKPLSALILIASALLLSAANAANPNPKSQRATKANTPEITQQNEGSQSDQGIPNVSSPTSVKEKSDPFNSESEKSERQREQEVQIEERVATFTGLLAVVSVIQALLLGFSLWISKSAVQIAESSLHTDRPFLFVEKPDFHPAERGKMSAVFILRNRGKGPAIIHELRAGLKFTNSRQARSRGFPQRADYRQTAIIEVTDNVLGAGDQSSRYEAWLENENLSLDEIHKEIVSGEKELVLCGVVSFSDSFGDWKYEAGFCWSERPEEFRPLAFKLVESYNEIKKR
jgi:hypothetical protein